MIDITKNIYDKLFKIYKKNKIKREDMINIKNYNLEFATDKEALYFLEREGGLLLNNNNKCFFFKDNKSKISKGDDGIWRYFSNNNKTKEFFYLTISDFYKIFTQGYNLNERYREMFEDYNIKTIEGEWKMKQENIYVENMKILSKKSRLNRLYPNLFRLIKGNLILLEVINSIGLSKVENINNQVDGKNVFRCSASYVINHINEYGKDVGFNPDQGRVNRSMNFLSAIGLLNKEDIDNIPQHMIELELIDMKKNKRKGRPMTSFYTVPEYTRELLESAEELAIVFRKHKLTYSSMSMSKLSEVDPDLADKIYGNNKKHINKVVNGINNHENDDIRSFTLPF